MPREIDTAELTPVISNLVVKACCELDENVTGALKAAYAKEKSPYGMDALDLLIKNAEYAKNERIACCHDTGSCMVILEIGQNVRWKGKPLFDAVNDGVRKGYEEGYLRKSMVRDPLDRVNTGDNTPAILYTEIVPGDGVTIKIMPKGGGSENMGVYTNLVPAVGADGVKEFIVDAVKNAGGKPCPPVIVGVGIGGTMDKCCIMAKKASLRPIGSRNNTKYYADMEEELLKKINNLGIGPLGMGGINTALDVHIEYYPCHITSLPVAVSFQCHASRLAVARI